MYKLLLKHNTSVGKIGNTGYQVLDEDVAINAFMI